MRLRERGEVHVATRSPTPASPAMVAGLAPNAIPSRMISARPRVMIAAAVFSPSPTPAAIPQANAMTFLHAPPTSAPMTSALVYGRKYAGRQRALQGHRPAGVAARDNGGCRLFVGDLAGQVRAGDHRNARRVSAGHLHHDLAHPHQRVQLDALGQAHQRDVVADQARPAARGWRASSATAPRAAPCTRRPALRPDRWWRGSTSAARYRRDSRRCDGCR